MKLKAELVSADLIDRSFRSVSTIDDRLKVCSWLHSVESLVEARVNHAYDLPAGAVDMIYQDLGRPAGEYPLLAGYSDLPKLAESAFPTANIAASAVAVLPRIACSSEGLAAKKANLRQLFERGPGEDSEPEDSGGEVELESETAVSHLPTETFLEELSQKLQVHPISVYGLLQEIRAEGARCKPEEQRLLEDRLSVMVLRLLGHRWPKQIEAGEPVPVWVDADGIIPLLSGFQ